VEWAIAVASSTFRPRARIVTELEEVPPVLASEVRLSQVVINLLLNAAQAMPAGRPDDNEIRVALRRVDDQVVLEVADTGTGMTPEVQRRIFDPFFTTKQRGIGAGLGLSTAYGVIKAAGGDVEVESQPGAGSLFRVTMPRAADDAVAVPAGDDDAGGAAVDHARASSPR